MKVLDDGRILYFELPRSEPLPPVIEEMAGDASVEALLLEAYRGWPAEGEGAVTVHTSGRILAAETEPSDLES